MTRTLYRLLLLATAALVAAPSPATADEWTIEDLVTAETITGWDVDSGLGRVVWVRTSVENVDGEQKRVSNLWMTPLAGGESRQLTRGTDVVSRPRLSPDGRYVAFLSTRELPKEDDEKAPEAEPQLWILPLDGGEAWPLTRFDRPVEDFDWQGDSPSPETPSLVVLAQESPTAREEEVTEEQKDTAWAVDDPVEEPPVRLFRATLDGEVRRLTRNDDWIDWMAVAPDGRRAVVLAQQILSYDFAQRVAPQTWIVDLETGERTQRLFADGVIIPLGAAWAPDSKGLYVTNARTRHPLYREAYVIDLHYHDLGSGETVRVTDDWERGVFADTPIPEPLDDGVLVLLADGVRARPARYVRRDGAFQRTDLTGPHVKNIDDWRPSRDGKAVAYLSSAINRPTQLYAARLDAGRLEGERQVSQINPDFETKEKGRYEVLQWKGSLGESVEGILQYPLDESEGEKRPLVVDIHGGPNYGDFDSWPPNVSTSSPNILWRQSGAFVLQVNYHGSAGYGLDWAESIEKRYYELEVPDIEAGVDLLIGRGLVDPQRMASSGWSNGGILTAGLIVTTDRYKAAIVGAADVEWLSDWANVDFGASFDNLYFGSTPWEDPQAYLEKSPFFDLPKVTTPTLVHTGTEDRAVPPHQSWSLFRVMQYVGKAPVRLVLYPGEPHGLQEIAHQRRKIREDVLWLNRYLFGTHEEPNPAVQEGSLLDALTKRAGAARQGEDWGVGEKGVLVPETVAYEGLQIGRFEVTRAQWASFTGKPARGDGNLPATGMSFDQARAYALWLVKTTGRPYRLPTKEEAERLAEEAGTDGNTLDRWAGYTPNPDDAARLLAALGELGRETPLLLPVGQLAAAGENGVFDLDGNAAEWATADDGSGVAAGPSAERSTDERDAGQPAAVYTGLRVVLDPL